MDRLADVVKATMQAAVMEIKSASTALAESSMQFTATATSYRDVLTSKGPPSNSPTRASTVDMRVRVREGIKSHQNLLDSQSRGRGEGILCGVSNTGLVEAANKALRNMVNPPEHHFVSAHRLGNGRVLLEMDSEEAAGWLNASVSWATFLNRFAPDASVKEWAFPMVVQFVPLFFKPEKEAEIYQVERDNDLPEGSILHAHWIKPAYRQACDQTCGHVIFVASTANAANKMLTSSLVGCQKRVYAKKCKKEPTRCLKCQGWGHLSYDCMLTHDTYGMCAGRHRMASCTPGAPLTA